MGKWFGNHTFYRVVAETNIFDVAIGLAVAGVFTKLVNAFVSYILTPPIGALIKGKSLANFEVAINLWDKEPVVFRYGMFLDTFVEFFLVAIVVYWSARIVLKIKKAGAETIFRSRNCKHCYMKIPQKAKICPYCQSILNE